jgi:hypothetical protein
MKEYSYKVIAKNPGTEVNVARLLQPVDFTNLKIEIEESKEQLEEKKIEGPRKGSVSVSSRRTRKEDKAPEYLLKCQTGERIKSWLGRSEESSKYAILVFDGVNVRMVLTDHWYKFSPIFQNVKVEGNKELTLGKVKRQKEEAELEKEVLGEDSEEDKPKKKPKVRRRREEDENESGKEGMDYNDEFTDDEEVVEDDEKEKSEEAALKHDLSISGKEMQKVLLETKNESGEESGDSSDIGLSYDEEELEGINKQAVINELMRLGRTTLKGLISECTKKYKSENNLKNILSEIIKEVGDISGTGESAEIVLKDEYKKTMPSFGVRIHFQTKK